MRILYLADRLSQRGGSDWHLLGAIGSLAEEHAVHLAVGREDGTAGAPCPTTRLDGLDARTRVPVALEPLIDSLRPDVIHVHNVVNPAVLESAADRGALITVQDHRFFCPGKGKWTANGRTCRDAMRQDVCASCFEDHAYLVHILSLTLERLEALKRLRVIVLSDYMKRELAAVGVPEESTTVIPPFVHGLDPDAAADGPPCVLFVGRLVEAKGVRDAIDAWRRSGVELPLVLAGTGPLRAKIAEAGCEVLGWVPHERLSALYRRARVVVMPSRWQEPFGIAGLEALTMGVPVAAWDSGGIGEWHPGEGLVEWGDLDGLARALRAAIGRRATPPARFDRERLMGELVGVYEATARAGQARF